MIRRQVLSWAAALVLAGGPAAACAGVPTGASGATSGAGGTQAAGPGAAQGGGAAGTGQEGADAAQAAQATLDAEAVARAEVARLPLRRLAAQLVVPGQAGTAAQAAATIRAQGYGGVVVFAGNLPTGAALVPAATKANAGFDAAVRGSGRPWPAFVAVDQEGGPVTRLGPPLTRFPAAMALGATRTPGLATQVGAASGAELRRLGYTVVMAPVADVTIGAGDPTIGVRSPGGDPALVSRTALAYVTGYRRAGVLPVVKHFPGHGSVRGDTHTGAATQPARLSALLARDLVPFRDAASARVPAVMTAHVTLPAVDRSAPASLSRPVTTGLLRERLKFRGLVVTDALNMGAAAKGRGSGTVAVDAVAAGADVVLMPADPAAAVTGLAKAVETGRLSRARLEESAARMIAALRVAATGGLAAGAAPGSHAALARRVAAASVTQVSGRCGGRLVGPAVTVSGGSATDRARFTAAARAAGLRIGGAGATRVVLLAGGAYRAADGKAGGPSSGTGDVLVALDAPHGLARSRATRAALAAYGSTPETFAAVADVLVGRAKAPGKLPVAVGSWQVGSGCRG